MQEFPLLRLPALVLVVASAVPAFRDWQGFRFGKDTEPDPHNVAWAVERLPDGRLLLAGQTSDSTCCQVEDIGKFGGDHPAGAPAVPFAGFLDSSGAKWSPTAQWGMAGPKPRWRDLKERPGSGFVTAGEIADTIYFSGTRKVWFGGGVANSTNWWDRDAIFGAGGGARVGVGLWSDSLLRLRLLRFRDQIGGVTVSQLDVDFATFTVAGSMKAGSMMPLEDGWIHEGGDSLRFRSWPTGTCFVIRVPFDSSARWLATLPCHQRMVTGVTTGVVSNSSGVWTIFNLHDTLDMDPDGHPWFPDSRPGLARLDSRSGSILDSLHPFGAMHGVARAIATRADGALLLQGDQGSRFEGTDGSYPVVLDSVKGVGWNGSVAVLSAGWLALLDPAGQLRKFRPLHPLENAGGWILRSHPEGGWVALTWDENDLLGFSRLYHFDDSLALIDSSPRLPTAVDMEIGRDGEILLSGWVPAGNTTPWLRGTGALWTASCRTGVGVPTGAIRSPAARMELRARGGTLDVGSTVAGRIRVRAFDHRGAVLLDRSVEPGATIRMPEGLSIWMAEQAGSRAVGRFLAH